MQVKTILNMIEPLKGFVYVAARKGTDADGKVCIEVLVRARKGSQGKCSGCGTKGPQKDRRPRRAFAYVPLWGIPVFLLYSLRRVICPKCGVKVEQVPWCLGKSPISRSFALYLADWAKVLPWKDVATRFKTTWVQVRTAVTWVVEWGLRQRDLSGVKAIGVDEIHLGRGQGCITVVYQLCGSIRRLLYVGQGHKATTLLRFFHEMGPEWCDGITHACTDMWKAYLTVIKKKLKNALNILDRFHIVARLNEAVDEVRRKERKKMKSEGYEDLLHNARYCFLKNRANMTAKQKTRLRDILHYDLKTVRAYLLKQSFNILWHYTSPTWARRYLKLWCARAMRSRLEPIQKFVGTIRRHEDLIMNWFEAKKLFSSGVVEGLNRKVNLITRRAYGYRSFEVMQVALFHALGHLPEPDRTHTF